MVFAIATVDQLVIYSTESILPLVIFKNLHFDSINDITWLNSSLIAICSSDGFVSFINVS